MIWVPIFNSIVSTSGDGGTSTVPLSVSLTVFQTLTVPRTMTVHRTMTVPPDFKCPLSFENTIMGKKKAQRPTMRPPFIQYMIPISQDLKSTEGQDGY